MKSRSAAKPLRALIVDDEAIARRVLREEIEAHPGITVAGEADSGRQALQQIIALRPDVIFLDLQMPEMGGFEVIERLPSKGRLPVVIIVTAYDRYAIQAFEAGAVDYLLKPVAQKRLARSLERARRVLRSGRQTAENLAALQEIAGESRASPPSPARMVGKLGNEYFLLSTDEVMAFQADGDLVWIVTEKQRYLATQSLSHIQNKLEGGSFRRVHRSALVNLDHVRKMAPLSSQRWILTMRNNQEFIVSKRLASSVRHALHW